MRLLILSNVIHYRHEGRLHAYGAYAREIDVWADLFTEVGHRRAVPRSAALQPGGAVHAPEHLDRAADGSRRRDRAGEARTAAGASRAALGPVPGDAEGGRHSRALPRQLRAAGRAARRRCSRATWWPSTRGSGTATRASRGPCGCSATCWARGGGAGRSRCTAAGRGRRAHVVPFFTSVLTRAQLARAERVRRAAHLRRTAAGALRGAALGGQERGRAAARHRPPARRRRSHECTVAGDGAEREQPGSAGAACWASRDRVEFTGGLDLERVLDAVRARRTSWCWHRRRRAGPRRSPKPWRSGSSRWDRDRGLVPEMLGEGRGFVVPPRDVDGAGRKRCAAWPAIRGELAAMSARAAAWSRQYSLDGLARRAARPADGLVERAHPARAAIGPGGGP